MIYIKQCILIYISENTGAKRIVDEICAGMEEEGVRYEVSYLQALKLSELSFMAAHDSAFGCGIGVCGDTAALQLINMKKGEYVFCVVGDSLPKFRELGLNAARTLKKQPYIINAT